MLQTENLRLNKIELTDSADITVINPNWDTVETEITSLKTNKADVSYVNQKVADIVGSAPEALDTLKELSTALGNDPNFATTVATQIGGKVDKVSGMGLSSNDYTTTEKNKLAGIATNANNYTHPTSHPASMIVEDSSKRFVSDTEKTTWNGKLDKTGGTLTGNIAYTMYSSTQTPMKVYGGDSNGQGLSIGAGGTTIISSGECKEQLEINLLPATEVMAIGSDQTIEFHTALQNGWTSRKSMTMGTDGTLTNNNGFIGNLTGNASTATKLATPRTINGVSFDGSANITVADSTKLPLSGGTLTGVLNTNSQINSTVASGTAPFTVASTTAVTNLNADMLDGLHSSSFLRGDTSNSSNLQFGSESGLGVRFFSSSNFSICMAQSDNSTYGGRVSGETTSDYNMYFRMGTGTNRGFVFKNEGNCVMGIDASGNVRAKGSMTIGDNKVKMQYNSTTESLDFIFV